MSVLWSTGAAAGIIFPTQTAIGLREDAVANEVSDRFRIDLRVMPRHAGFSLRQTGKAARCKLAVLSLPFYPFSKAGRMGLSLISLIAYDGEFYAFHDAK